MSTYRRYLIASSLARLIRKERGGNRVTEGHFPNQADRNSYVIVEGDKGSLVLISTGPGGPVEERTDVPRAHAEALLDVTPSKVDYLLTPLSIGTRNIHLVRYVTPGPLDMVSVEFDSEDEARDFRPLSWFGDDVTTEPAFQNRAIALEGLPDVPDVPISNTALNSLLDTLENRYSAPRTFVSHRSQRNPAEATAASRSPAPAAGPSSADDDEASERREEPSPRAEPMATADVEVTEDENNEHLNIEDNVIRELARSLRPQRR